MGGKYAFLKVALAAPGRLTQEEEKDLVKKFQQGDLAAYRRLRISLRPLMEGVIGNALPSNNSISSSNLRFRAENELRDILLKYDPNQNVKLSTYVTGQLRHRLSNATKENVIGPHVPRNQHDDLYRYRQAIRSATMEFGTNPTEDQIKQFYPQDSRNPFDKIKHYHVRNFLSDAEFGGEDEDDPLTFKDKFTVGQNTITDDDLFASDFEEDHNELVSTHFNNKEQQVIDKVMKEGQRIVQVALSLGMDTSEVSKIMRRYHSVTQAQ